MRKTAELLMKLNEHGGIFDYLYVHKDELSFVERNLVQFLKDLKVEPIEVPGKVITLTRQNPGFRLGVFKLIGGNKTKEDYEAKFEIMTPGWRFNGCQIAPIEVSEIARVED